MLWAAGARQRLAPVTEQIASGREPRYRKYREGAKRMLGAGLRWPAIQQATEVEDAGARHGLAPVGSDLLPGRSLLTRRFAAAAQPRYAQPTTLRSGQARGKAPSNAWRRSEAACYP